MKKIIPVIIGAAMLLLYGCSDSQQENLTPAKEPKLLISNPTSEIGSIILAILAIDGDLKAYDRWGIVYGETRDKSQGQEIVSDNKPSDKKKEIRLTGLKEGATYYIWEWAEGPKTERIWSKEVSIRVKSKDDPARLDGTVIGSTYSADSNGNKSTTVNTKGNVFDKKFDTYFSSYDKSWSWVGLDLGSRHVIKQVGYSPREYFNGAVQLAIIEGANEPDFSDALPIYMIKEHGQGGEMTYADVNCSRGFRYVRYVSANEARCNLAELEFLGHEGEGDDSQFYQLTNLPTVVINTEGAKDITSKEVEIPSTVYIISQDGKNLLATTQTGVRGRGNASWGFPKKPYRLKFDKKQSPLGAPASAKKWTLINNWGDKTLMRNMLAFEISRRVGQSYTPFSHPVDVILNGEYRGCYQLCDQIEAASGRVEAKDGYLIEIDAYADGEPVWFRSQKGTPVTIKHPDEEDITPEQQAFIKDFFNTMEAAVDATNFTDETNGYRKYLDLDSFLRNFIVGEFGGNTDTYWSTYMYKDAGDGRLYTGPAWDYDLGFDNDQRTHPIIGMKDYIYCTKGSLASSAVKNMVSRIVKEDPKAKERLIEIWEEACENGGLDHMNSYVDQIAAMLQESQELNFKRWPILSEKVHQNYQALGSYDAEVKVLKTYIEGRLSQFDQLIRK